MRPGLRRLLVVVVTLVACALALAAALWVREKLAPAPVVPVPAGAGRVVYVDDGDTLDIEINGLRTRVRLLGIDAPEIGHDGTPDECGAVAARERLTELVGRGDVVVLTDPAADARDRFGRTLAYVEVEGIDLGGTLVGEGLVGSWSPSSSPRPSRQGTYEDLQATARAAKQGSWATCDRLGR